MRKGEKTTFPTTPQGVPVVTNVYDNRDWLTKTINPLLQTNQFTNDLAHRLIAVVDPISRTNTFAYDADNRRTNAANAASETTHQQWTSRGELLAFTDQAGKPVGYGHDPAGNQILLTNRNGKIWQFQFDKANRLTNTITPLGRTNVQAFNNRGLLQAVTNSLGQPTTFGYDAMGRLTSRTDLVATTTFIYDANGNLTTNSENGQSLVRTFDAYDRLSSYTGAAGNLIQYRYDANGNLTSLIYPGSRTVTYAYDSLNRLTNVTDWATRQTSFTYDLASRLTSITRPNGTVRSNFYDAAGQLTNIIEQAASHAPIAFFKLSWSPAARVQWEFMAPTNRPYTPPTRTMLFDADNRLTNFNGSAIVNDNNGNMTSGPLTNSTLLTYSYDARNRLLSAGGLDYAYDPANNRVAVTNDTNIAQFIFSPNGSQVLMRIKSGMTNYYVYGAGLLYEVDETATSTNTATYHFDLRGSTVALTDGSGNITDQIQYSAYGIVTYRAGTNDTPFLYNGRYGVQTDSNGLLYMRARYYNPYICRFINADPSGFAGGLNFYAYADGNPISLTDPFGLGTKEAPGLFSWVNISSAFVNAAQAVLNQAYTGQWNPSQEVYDAATSAAGDYVYDDGGVRGFYGGVGLNGKFPGSGSLAGQVGVTGTWTIDSGAGSEIDAGLGLQERGRNSLGAFSSQTVGVGGSYQFYSQDTGFQASSFGSVSGPAIYGGTANRVGGANFGVPMNISSGPVALGINYGAGYGGILIDPSKIWGNLLDSYHIITETP